LSDVTNSKIVSNDPINAIDNVNRTGNSFQIIKDHYSRYSKPEYIAANSHIAYIVRDFRDVIVSGFFHTHRGLDEARFLLAGGSFIGKLYFDFEMNLMIDRWGGNSVARCKNSVKHFVFFKPNKIGNRSDHVNFWFGFGNVVVIKYEDLLKDPGGVIQNIVTQFDIDCSGDAVRKAVERQSFQARKKIFQKRHDIINEKFLRKGVSGDWVNFLSPKILKRVEEKHGKIMRKLGYDI